MRVSACVAIGALLGCVQPLRVGDRAPDGGFLLNVGAPPSAGRGEDGGLPDGGLDAGGLNDGGPTGGATDGGLNDAGDRDGGTADGGLRDAGDPLAELSLDGGWFRVRQGLFGGAIAAAARAASSPDVVYAVTPAGRVFVSLNDGRRWDERARIIPFDPKGWVSNITIQVNPTNDQEAFLSFTSTTWVDGGQEVRSFLLRSVDGARTWVAVGLPLQAGSTLAVGARALWVVEPVSIGVARLHRSDNGGQTFSTLSLPIATNQGPTSIIASPSNDQEAWLQNDREVWRTTNGGASWGPVGPPLAVGSFYARLEHAPTSPGRLILSVANALAQISTNGGATWQPASSQTQGHWCVPATASNALWCESWSGALMRSPDGQTWYPVGVVQSVGTQLLLPRDDQDALVVGIEDEVSRPNNGTLERSVDGITSVKTTAAALHASGQRLVVGTALGQVFVSADDGRTWTRGGGGLPHGRVQSVLVDPMNPLVVYAVVSFVSQSTAMVGFYKSIDGGGSFFALTRPTGVDGSQLYSFMTDVVTVGSSGVLATSTNGGSTWSTNTPTNAAPTVLDCSPAECLAIPAADVVGRLLSSTDRSLTWTTVSGPPELERTTQAAIAAGTTYVATERLFLALRSAGWSTAEVNLVIPRQFDNRFPFRLLKAAGPELVVGATDATIHSSVDAAALWSNLPAPAQPTALAVSADGRRAVIGFDGEGVLILRR
jgi:hypothetical protein